MIKNLFNNWKTTSAGIALIITNTVHLVFAVRNHTSDENTWIFSLTAIVGGIGLIFAGDASQSSPKPPTPPVTPPTP